MAPEDFLVTVKPNRPCLNLTSYSTSEARLLVGGGVFIGTSYLFALASYICTQSRNYYTQDPGYY